MRTIRTRGFVAAVISVLFVFSGSAFAQDDDDGGPQTQGDDARYLSITYVDFKPGKRGDAMQIIDEYFVPAAEKAGTAGPILAVHFQTGKWDAAYIWEMAGGMADLEWFTSPDDIKWRAALAEIAGGEEEGAQVWQDYLATVANVQREVGHHHVPDAD